MTFIEPACTIQVADSLRGATISCHAPSSAPWFHLPVGVFAILTGCAAAIAAFRVEKMQKGERAAWVIVFALFTAAELRMIVWSDVDAKKEREYSECEVQRHFQEIERENQQTFQQTMCEVGKVFGKTTQAADSIRGVATLAKQSLEDITGGISYAYLRPDFSETRPTALWKIHNYGKNSLSGIVVKVYPIESGSIEPFGNPNTVIMAPASVFQVGTLGGHSGETISNTILVPKHSSYEIYIMAQNGTTTENLLLRPSADGKSYAYRLEVWSPAWGKHHRGDHFTPGLDSEPRILDEEKSCRRLDRAL